MRQFIEARRRAVTGDAGISMIEVMVSMVVMSIVLIIFTTGILQAIRITNQVQSVFFPQAQANLVFTRLDKQVRYAAAVSQAGTVGVDPVVEYLTTNTGSRVCTELRLHNGQLQRRTWTQTTPVNAVAENPTAWVVVVTKVVPNPGTPAPRPFKFHDADSNTNFQRLEVFLTVSDGKTTRPTTRATHVTFTALNSSLSSQGDTTECTELRGVK